MTGMIVALVAGFLTFAPVIVEPTTPKVGDIVSITLPVELADGERIVEARPVAFPADTPIGSASVLDPAGTLQVTVEARKAGALSIGPVEYLVALSDGETAIRAVIPPTVEIASNLAPDDDGEPAFDATVVEVPFDWRTAIIPSAAVALAVALLVALGVWLKRRLKRRGDGLDGLITLSARDFALKLLDELEHENPFATGDVRRHFYLISEIVRNYIEAVYDIPAMERTTRELAADFARRREPIKDAEEYLSLFRECDRIKFTTTAAASATPDEAAHALAEARRIIRLDPDRGLNQ